MIGNGELRVGITECRNVIFIHLKRARRRVEAVRKASVFLPFRRIQVHGFILVNGILRRAKGVTDPHKLGVVDVQSDLFRHLFWQSEHATQIERREFFLPARRKRVDIGTAPDAVLVGIIGGGVAEILPPAVMVRVVGTAAMIRRIVRTLCIGARLACRPLPVVPSCMPPAARAAALPVQIAPSGIMPTDACAAACSREVMFVSQQTFLLARLNQSVMQTLIQLGVAVAALGVIGGVAPNARTVVDVRTLARFHIPRINENAILLAKGNVAEHLDTHLLPCSDLFARHRAGVNDDNVIVFEIPVIAVAIVEGERRIAAHDLDLLRAHIPTRDAVIAEEHIRPLVVVSAA